MEQQPIQPIKESMVGDSQARMAGIRKANSQGRLSYRLRALVQLSPVMDDPLTWNCISMRTFHSSPRLPAIVLHKRAWVRNYRTLFTLRNRLGHAVAVHCTSGRRRTGTMLASLDLGWFLLRGGDADDQDTNPDAGITKLKPLSTRVSEGWSIAMIRLVLLIAVMRPLLAFQSSIIHTCVSVNKY